jgi:hypothetical protein
MPLGSAGVGCTTVREPQHVVIGGPISTHGSQCTKLKCSLVKLAWDACMPLISSLGPMSKKEQLWNSG